LIYYSDRVGERVRVAGRAFFMPGIDEEQPPVAVFVRPTNSGTWCVITLVGPFETEHTARVFADELFDDDDKITVIN
jgi:hypothetical protein